MAEPKRILIVEDHPIFRWGLRELINQEADLVVCGEAEDPHQAWTQIQERHPDLIIADITLQNGDGIDLVKDVARDYKNLPVLILSMHDEFLYAQRALHAGARGYIMKQEAMDSVVTAVRHVLDGKIYLNETVKEHILAQLTTDRSMNPKASLERLTDRELEVFRLIGKGFSTREIAEKLNLSIKTIGTYRERIKEKLNLKHATELVRCAVHWEKSGEIDTL